MKLFLSLLLPLLCTAADPKAPDNFLIDFKTDIDGVGVFTMNVTRSWAPIGVDHLYALVNDGFYDEAAFFRVVGGFVLQFGIAGTPAENQKWSTAIMDDPVIASNKQWTVSYATAGPDTRTTQLFVNYKDNTNLDRMGFAPIATVVEGSEYLLRVYDPTPGNSNGVDQEEYETKGNEWIRQKYPEINFITKATVRNASSPLAPPAAAAAAGGGNDEGASSGSGSWARFESWVGTHGDTAAYAGMSAKERLARFAVFQANEKRVEAHNARYREGKETFFLSLNNPFADMTPSQWKQTHRARSAPRASSASSTTTFSPISGPTPPAEFDWRTKGVVTNVKNQFEPHSCGSCWAFSAVAGMESRYAMDGNTLTSFSAQNLVDCTLGGKDNCNNGGEMHDGVLQVVNQQKGYIATAKAYPYTGLSKGVCHFDQSTAVLTNVSGYANVTAGDEKALLQAVFEGGVSPSAVNADADAFMFYSGGVISVPNCPTRPDQLDHGVAVVGWGSDQGQDYWLVKNSYGEYWGEKGYFRIVRGKNMCGIATDCIVVKGK